ncbi:TetR/AcrR family transcriptional regulator [Yoonia algicola]|uniref:TetR/AcrR family transcriptional regulator n=1 Tax=Yoonia algicola TaxID=3137368 RepID=A0AAN0M3T4_9RHOB
MSGDTDKPTKRKRYSPDERRQMIIDASIKFFAEQGFDSSTHQLAKHIGVTQPLIYQYFPSKEDLISAVYAEMFQNRWSDEWDVILADRNRDLRDRLEDFYTRYCAVIHAPDWIRIFLYSGLKGGDITRRYAPIVEERAIRRICIEARDAFHLPSMDQAPLTNEEFEAAWMMHGGIFYYGVRRYVYGGNVGATTEQLVQSSVTLFMDGMSGVARSVGLLAKS